MRKLFVLFIAVFAAVLLVGCGGSTRVLDEDGNVIVQGVTDDKILVGNTASQTGAYNSIGIPFSQMIQAVFDEYNRGTLKLSDGTKGLINGRKIEYTVVDDKSTAEGGRAGYEKLTEDTEVFALVGHFGTWTVAPTVKDIQKLGIPMVHAATGVNDLFFTGTVGNPVMAIQPIYKTDGMVMVARAFASEIYGANADQALPENAKWAIVYSNDDAGKSILAGVNEQLEKLSIPEANIVREIISTDDAAAGAQKSANADVIIVASNQPPFKTFVSALHGIENSKAPIFTSYVNADASHMKKEENNVGDIYMMGWYNDDVAEKAEFDRIIDASTRLSAEEKAELKSSTHAKSGYIAATTFIEGLRRVGTKELNWKNYIAAMEEAPINLLLAGGVDYTNGQRWGTDTMSLWIYNRAQEIIEVTDSLKSIPEILGED